MLHVILCRTYLSHQAIQMTEHHSLGSVLYSSYLVPVWKQNLALKQSEKSRSHLHQSCSQRQCTVHPACTETRGRTANSTAFLLCTNSSNTIWSKSPPLFILGPDPNYVDKIGFLACNCPWLNMAEN